MQNTVSVYLYIFVPLALKKNSRKCRWYTRPKNPFIYQFSKLIAPLTLADIYYYAWVSACIWKCAGMRTTETKLAASA